jgi:hypothetical protein
MVCDTKYGSLLGSTASFGFLGKNFNLCHYVLCIVPALLHNHSSSLTFAFTEDKSDVPEATWRRLRDTIPLFVTIQKCFILEFKILY